MKQDPIVPARVQRAIPFLTIAALGAPLAAQSCTQEGVQWIAAARTDGPALGCPYAPTAPAWRLFTPEHRLSVPQAGSTFVEATALPRILVRYRCTGLWLCPVVVDDVKELGYVLDVRVAPCGG